MLMLYILNIHLYKIYLLYIIDRWLIVVGCLTEKELNQVFFFLKKHVFIANNNHNIFNLF